MGTAGANRSKPAWKQVYRALEHGQAKNNCQNNRILKKFPKDVEDFASMFVSLQIKRHSADYDPDTSFYKSDVQQDIAAAHSVISRFNKAKAKDRRAFAALVLFKLRP